jgi:hypothetical protein
MLERDWIFKGMLMSTVLIAMNATIVSIRVTSIVVRMYATGNAFVLSSAKFEYIFDSTPFEYRVLVFSTVVALVLVLDGVGVRFDSRRGKMHLPVFDTSAAVNGLI